MEITLLQIVLVFIVACIAGMESVLDEFQFHRPLIACTLIGAVLGDMKTGIIIGGTLEMIAPGWMNIGAAVALMPRWRPLFPPSRYCRPSEHRRRYRAGYPAGGGRPC